MPGVRRLCPKRVLHKKVPRAGSNAPFSKDRRHVALNKVLRGGFTYKAASLKVSAFVKTNYVDTGDVDARSPSTRSIRRWTSQLATHGRSAALSPSGRSPVLTADEDDFILSWAREVKFFTQVRLRQRAPTILLVHIPARFARALPLRAAARAGPSL